MVGVDGGLGLGIGPRLGIYICHCGTNISKVIDIKRVTQEAGNLPGVVISRDYKYMCSCPGQDLIQSDIKEHKLDRIIMVSCSPLLHEETFWKVMAKSGLNPFSFQMVNIREQVAWVHDDQEAATVKASDLIRAAASRIVYCRPLLERKQIDIHPSVLVVGGGIAGIHAALTIAKANQHVYLIEREPTIGGHMAKFDKTFPTLDCAACILAPKMTQVKAHPKITLWALSEMIKVDGYIGHYRVQIKRKPRYIREDLCVGCLQCIEACVYQEPQFPSEFDLGLGQRKPIFFPFPQAIPNFPLIDPLTCIQLKSGKCEQLCLAACKELKAIDFEQKDTIEEIEVGAIIISTGFKAFDPARLPQYGYGIYPNVYTALEIERLINASGPTSGQLLLSNGQKPTTVGIIHCVGSRDMNTNQWCSRVCCLYSLKLAHLIKEHTEATIYNFYLDLRTPGKGMEEFCHQISSENIHLIRGKVAQVVLSDAEQDRARLIIYVENTLMGLTLRIPVDLVVLAVGLEPPAGTKDLCRILNIPYQDQGFFLERHPKLAPVNALTDGIFLAGCCQGPKDIPDTVAQAGAAAGEVLALIDSGYVELEPYTVYIMEEGCSGCKTCLSLCPYKALSFDTEKKKVMVDEINCRGCGVCVSACPSGSIKQKLFEDDEIFGEIGGMLSPPMSVIPSPLKRGLG